MKKKGKIILGIVMVFIILGVFLIEKNKGIKVNVLEVKPRTISQTFNEEGEVISQVQCPISSVSGGRIIDLPVSEGQQVKKGEILVIMDSKELEFQLAQLKGNLKSLEGEEAKVYQKPLSSTVKSQQLQVEQAERDLQTAVLNYNRASELYQAGALNNSEYKEAENLVQKAKNYLQQQKEALSLIYESHNPDSGTKSYYTGRKEALEAQIRLVNYQIGNCKIKSPIDGIVSNLSVKKGEVISPGIPVMTVFQKDDYEIEVFVLTEDIRYIKLGMKVDLIQETKDKDIFFEGRVKWIAPFAIEKTSALGLEEKRIKIILKPIISGGVDLRPGYSLDVKFTVAKQENKLVVPKTALFKYESSDGLWVVREGKAQIQTVKKGFENGREVVIENGLKEGDLVILNPQLKGLKKGIKVIKERM